MLPAGKSEEKEGKREQQDGDDLDIGLLKEIEEEMSNPNDLDDMINQGNQVQEDYKEEIAAAKRAEAEKYRKMMEEEEEK